MNELPDAALLGEYVERSALSANKIAAFAGITGTQLRNYVRGVDNRGLPVKIPTSRLVDLAHALGIPSEKLRDAGRADAADRVEAGRSELPKVATLQERLERLRDEVDSILRDVRKGRIP